MTEFKKGDLVICIESDSSKLQFIKNKLYIVKKVEQKSTWLKFVKDSSGSTTNGWASIHFKKIKNTKLGKILYE